MQKLAGRANEQSKVCLITDRPVSAYLSVLPILHCRDWPKQPLSPTQYSNNGCVIEAVDAVVLHTSPRVGLRMVLLLRLASWDVAKHKWQILCWAKEAILVEA